MYAGMMYWIELYNKLVLEEKLKISQEEKQP